MTTRLRYPKGYQFFDRNGRPLALGRLYYYAAGTTAPQDTYADAAGTVANSNPVILDGSGYVDADVYLGPANDYKEVLTSSDGATVAPWPDDNIPRASASGGSAASTDLSVTEDASTVTVHSSTGASGVIPSATESLAGALSAADKAKLDGIAAGAQVQPTAAQIVSAINTQLGGTAWQADTFTGDAGSGGTKGLVPASGAGAAAAGEFLKADGTWAAPPQAAQADWSATSGPSQILNKPTIPAAQVNSDWSVSSGVAQILNKPALGTASAANVPASGDASASEVVLGSDTRLSNARTPTAHAASHGAGGSDPLSISASQVSGLAAALANQNVQSVAELGVGTSADATNKLAVASDAVLFTTVTGDHRTKLNKAAAANTASFLFQDNWSGRAEFGLIGNDNFTLKVAPDGSAWKTALTFDNTSGAASFPNSSGFAGDAGSGGAVGLVPAPTAGAAAAGKFLKADGTWAVPPGGGASDMVGATSSAAGAHGLVPAPAAGQQSLRLRGDATWADPGDFAGSINFRDNTIPGFSGAKFQLIQGAVQVTGYNSGTAFSIPISAGEVLFIEYTLLNFTSDYTKAYMTKYAKVLRRPISGSIFSLSITQPAYYAQESTGAIGSILGVSINNTTYALDFIYTGDNAYTYNIFVTAEVWRIKSNA